jgi:formate hydrogenlyase transcriptional activator
LQNALSEVERLKSRLQAENIYLQNEINLEHNFENIITNSNAFKKILHQLEQVATTDSTVLIVGETGTGKELLARAIHSLSKRKNRPLIKVDCAALPPNLIESELFGHEKGAFTGAISRKLGRFEIADKGTIFLDEVGEMPLELQTKLLRVLQEREIQRIGCNQTIQVDVRIIAATNRDLENEIRMDNFREDLFFRINVFPIHIPPLRERKEDIPLLVRYFVKKYNAKFGCKIEMIPQNVIDTLQKYHWPGNVRELENIIQRSIILSNNSKLVLGDWIQKNSNGNNHASLESLEENERRYILKILKQTDWRVSGEKGAAKILNVNPKTLFSRMEKLGIHRKNNFSEISEIS